MPVPLPWLCMPLPLMELSMAAPGSRGWGLHTTYTQNDVVGTQPGHSLQQWITMRSLHSLGSYMFQIRFSRHKVTGKGGIDSVRISETPWQQALLCQGTLGLDMINMTFPPSATQLVARQRAPHTPKCFPLSRGAGSSRVNFKIYGYFQANQQ